MKSSGKTKEQFLQDMADRNLFWSYDRNLLFLLPDAVIIEHVLKYGDTDDIIFLFKIYKYQFVKDVWTKSVLSDQRYKNLNYYLGKVFFHIKDFEGYSAKHSPSFNRYDRIRQLASRNEKSIG
jgi:hypothetical protein